MVVGDRQPAVDRHRQIHLGRRQGQRQRHGRPVHVFVHAGHVAGGLEVVAASVKADALADQRHGLARGLRLPRQMHDGGVLVMRTLRHGAEGSGTHFFQSPETEFLDAQAGGRSHAANALAIRVRRQFVGSQGGELARQHIGASQGAHRGKLGILQRTEQINLCQRHHRLLLAHRQRHAVDLRHIGRIARHVIHALACRDPDRDGLRCLVEQQHHRLAHTRQPLEARQLAIHHEQSKAATIGQIKRQRRLRQFLRLHRLAFQDRQPLIPLRQVGRQGIAHRQNDQAMRGRVQLRVLARRLRCDARERHE